MDWQTRLVAIRQEAARRCGLTEYPAELIAAYEDVHIAGWKNVGLDERERRLSRHAAARAEFSSTLNLGSQLCPTRNKRKAPIG